METETEQIFKEQIGKLPSEVIDFLSSSNWDTALDDIGALYNLHDEELSNFKREVTLVLAGLVHPDEFREALEQEVGVHGAVLEAIVANVENQIFAPIRPALIEFFEKEGVEDAPIEVATGERPAQMGGNESVVQNIEIPVVPTPTRTWERKPDIAPDNLPTAEDPFLPPIPEKISNQEESTHPFEEKMKRVFTAGEQSMGDLSLEPVAPQVAVPPVPHPYHVDPYREAVE